MSEKEVRPGFTSVLRSVITSYTSSFERTYYIEIPLIEKIPLKIVYMVDSGGVYGLKIAGSPKALKNVLERLLNHKDCVLLDTRIYLMEEPSIGLFFINTGREEDLWEIVTDLSNVEEIGFIEVIKPLRGSGTILFNPWIYPPRIDTRDYTLLPSSLLPVLVSSLNDDDAKRIARELIKEFKRIIGRDIDVDILLRMIESMGLCRYARSCVDKEKVSIEIKPIGENMCRLYRLLVEEVTGIEAIESLDSIDKCVIVYSSRA